MNSLLYIIAVILIIGWALGVFIYSAGGLIHVLLVIAVIANYFRIDQASNGYLKPLAYKQKTALKKAVFLF